MLLSSIASGAGGGDGLLLLSSSSIGSGAGGDRFWSSFISIIVAAGGSSFFSSSVMINSICRFFNIIISQMTHVEQLVQKYFSLSWSFEHDVASEEITCAAFR